MAECLPSKYQALNSNSSTTKKITKTYNLQEYRSMRLKICLGSSDLCLTPWGSISQGVLHYQDHLICTVKYTSTKRVSQYFLSLSGHPTFQNTSTGIFS
jgi:hypothetical protein